MNDNLAVADTKRCHHDIVSLSLVSGGPGPKIGPNIAPLTALSGE